jgi:hypothetical protein
MRKCTIFALYLLLLAANAAMAFAQPRNEGRDRDGRGHEWHFDRDRGRPEWRDGYRLDRGDWDRGDWDRGDWDRGDWDRGRNADRRDYRLREPRPGCE